MAKRLAIALTNLVRMNRTSHAGLSEYINPYNKLPWSTGDAWLPLPENSGLIQVEAKISRQAAMIGYRDVFSLSAITSILIIPVIFLIRRPAPSNGH